ncbi:MAG TPA: sigma 54-interacting transcriptional regulator [Candidatus Deferrimicrobium sp.]|nr:sigma 54-interacting transcriptional regulator [Candidatus Deferrimicrobium sp.]
MKVSVLLIDPDGSTQRFLQLAVGDDNYQFKAIDTIEAVADTAPTEVFDVVLLSGAATGETSVLNAIRRTVPDAAMVILTNSSDDNATIEWLCAGAADVVNQPVSNELLLLKLRRAAEHQRMKARLTALSQHAGLTYGYDNVIGISEPMIKLKEQIGRISSTDIPILLRGALGTGKSLLAGVIHHHSERRHGPLVEVDCAAVDTASFEAELFGRAGDDVTSLAVMVKSALERANKGTLLLESVDRLSIESQMRLLQFLQTCTLPSDNGQSNDRKVDLRTIATCEHDLSQLVAEGKFLRDLQQRLGVIMLRIPCLAERADDMELLIDYLLRRIAAESGSGSFACSNDAIERLRQYDWPVNVRELSIVLRRAVTRCRGEHIEAADFDGILSDTECAVRRETVGAASSSASNRLLEHNQRAVIQRALEDNRWNFSQTAQALGIGRTTLWRKVKKYDLRPQVALK